MGKVLMIHIKATTIWSFSHFRFLISFFSFFTDNICLFCVLSFSPSLLYTASKESESQPEKARKKRGNACKEGDGKNWRQCILRVSRPPHFSLPKPFAGGATCANTFFLFWIRAHYHGNAPGLYVIFWRAVSLSVWCRRSWSCQSEQDTTTLSSCNSFLPFLIFIYHSTFLYCIIE